MQMLFYKDAFGAFERLIQLVTWSRIVHVELAVAAALGLPRPHKWTPADLHKWALDCQAAPRNEEPLHG